MKGRVALALIGVMLLLCGTFFLHSYREEAATTYFSDALSKAGLSVPIQSDLVRSAYARALAERSPFFALPGTDPEKLRAAVADLEAAQEALADAQQDPKKATLVREALYPKRLLTAMARLEDKRLLFLLSESLDDLHTYEKVQRDAMRAYRDDLNAFRTAFEKVVPEDAPSFAAGNVRVSRQAVIDALEALTHGVNNTEQLMKARQRCMHGWVRACDDTALNYPTFATSTAKFSRDERAQASEILTLYNRARQGMPRPTVIEVPKGICTATIPGAAIFALYAGATSALPVYLGDIQLVDTHAQSSFPFYKYFMDRDIAYVPSQPLAPYMCPEFAEELATLLAMRSLGSSTENMPPEFALQWHNKSTDFDETVHYVALVARDLLESASRGAPGAHDAATLFYARSAFPALFFAHNPSVVGEHEVFFAPHEIPPSEQPFVFYSSLTKTTHLQNAIIDGIRAFDEVHGIVQP